jgi:hypothetical protein
MLGYALPLSAIYPYIALCEVERHVLVVANKLLGSLCVTGDRNPKPLDQSEHREKSCSIYFTNNTSRIHPTSRTKLQNSLRPTPIPLPHHSPHSPSSFFPLPPPLPGPFLTALVPIPLGLFFSATAPILCSPTLLNSSQKSCLSFAGPLGASPNESQKSFFSGARAEDDGSPSTKRLNVVPALATPEERVCPSVPAVRWA